MLSNRLFILFNTRIWVVKRVSGLWSESSFLSPDRRSWQFIPAEISDCNGRAPRTEIWDFLILGHVRKQLLICLSFQQGKRYCVPVSLVSAGSVVNVCCCPWRAAALHGSLLKHQPLAPWTLDHHIRVGRLNSPATWLGWKQSNEMLTLPKSMSFFAVWVSFYNLKIILKHADIQ